MSRDSGHKAEKTGTGQLRRDLEPLTKRFDALGSPAKAVWMSGTLGDPEVPGPSSYWIDAIVTLAPGEARSLRNKFRATQTEQDPEVVDELRTRLPEGPLLSSDALDSAFSEHGFAADAFLAVTSNQVVVTAKGQ